MNTEKYITASCTIACNKLIKNGKPLFEDSSANMQEFFAAVYKYLEVQYPKFYKMDNISKLGWLAAEALLKDTFDKDKYKAEEVGVVLSNANASLDSDIKYMDSLKGVPSPALFVYTLPNIVIGEISIRNGFKGENAFYITPKFDATLIYDQVVTAMETSGLQACICGWVDVLKNEYKATLYLVEMGVTLNGILFSAANMNSLF